jgi:hypothetical protein
MNDLLGWLDRQHWTVRALAAVILALTVGVAVTFSSNAARAWDRMVSGRFR